MMHFLQKYNIMDTGRLHKNFIHAEYSFHGEREFHMSDSKSSLYIPVFYMDRKPDIRLISYLDLKPEEIYEIFE
jgi:hypothetical protein